MERRFQQQWVADEAHWVSEKLRNPDIGEQSVKMTSIEGNNRYDG